MKQTATNRIHTFQFGCLELILINISSYVYSNRHQEITDSRMNTNVDVTDLADAHSSGSTCTCTSSHSRVDIEMQRRTVTPLLVAGERATCNNNGNAEQEKNSSGIQQQGQGQELAASKRPFFRWLLLSWNEKMLLHTRGGKLWFLMRLMFVVAYFFDDSLRTEEATVVFLPDHIQEQTSVASTFVTVALTVGPIIQYIGSFCCILLFPPPPWNPKMLLYMWDGKLWFLMRLVFAVTIFDDSLHTAVNLSDHIQQATITVHGRLGWLAEAFPSLISTLVTAILSVGIIFQFVGSFCVFLLPPTPLPAPSTIDVIHNSSHNKRHPEESLAN